MKNNCAVGKGSHEDQSLFSLSAMKTFLLKLCQALTCPLLFFVFLCIDVLGAELSSPTLLAVPPFLGRPTQNSITVNLVAAEKNLACYLMYRQSGEGDTSRWERTKEFSLDAFIPQEIKLDSLLPGRVYDYQVHARLRDGQTFQLVAEHRFKTKDPNPSSYSFAILSDSHITPFDKDRMEKLAEVSTSILKRKPNFFFMLGDNIQTFTSHGGPMTEERFGPGLYYLVRGGLGATPSAVPGFFVNGNWEGENGWHPEKERGWAVKARKAFIPNPGPSTYPEGGSENADYYAFTWGGVLFISLNVTGYTVADHTHGSQIGRADDWTLGEKQRTWLHEKLERSKEKWKLILIHHTVGGNAGDDLNSRYGRGGGRAANVGEQGLIHDWMKQYGVQALLYGHDHVFTDQVVDGIHYICVGSAGAPWKFGKEETGYDQFWTPSGYTWVDVMPGNLKISFIEPGDSSKQDRVLHSVDLRGK